MSENETDLLRVSVSTEYMECALVSGELYHRVHTLTQNPDAYQLEQVFVLEQEGVQEQLLDVIPLSEEFPLDANHESRRVRFGIGFNSQDPDSVPRLLLQTASGVAVPVASFGRGTDGGCDYVQVGDEMTKGNIVVTPEDAVRRKNQLADIAAVLKGNPFALLHGEQVREIIRSSPAARFTTDLKNKTGPLGGYNDEGYAIFAITERAKTLGSGHTSVLTSAEKKILERISEKKISEKKPYKKAVSELDEFMQHPSLRAVIDRQVPGTKDTVKVHAQMVALVAEGYGLDISKFGDDSHFYPERRPTYNPFYDTKHYSYYSEDARGVDRLLRDLDLVRKLDAQLGEYNPRFEYIVRNLARIAGQHVSVEQHTSIEHDPVSIGVDVMIEAVPDGNAKHQVVVEQLVSQYRDTDQAPKELARVVVDRTAASTLDAHQEAELIARLPHLLGNAKPIVLQRPVVQPPKRRLPSLRRKQA